VSSLRRPHVRAASSDDEEGFSIPLTPLIDVVFLLLIFFLLATTFIDVEKDLGIKLPPSAHGRERHKAAESVVVNVHRDGTLVVSGRVVTAEELYRELDAAWQRDVYTAVVVRGDARASHGTVVGVLDICRKARIVNVAVATFERAERP
jgi:biopolymer transport protein ExbD